MRPFRGLGPAFPVEEGDLVGSESSPWSDGSDPEPDVAGGALGFRLKRKNS